MYIIKDLKTASDINSIVKDNSNNTYNLAINLTKNGEYSNQKIDLLDLFTEKFDKMKEKVEAIRLYVPYEKIPKDKFFHLVNLNKKLDNKTKCLVIVNRQYVGKPVEQLFWDINTIIKANNGIDGVCKFIKDQNLSPFEALAFIHNYVSTIKDYQLSLSFYKYGHDQFFPAAYDNNDFVCAGYASLMEEIIDNLNMAELKCEILNIRITNKKENFMSNHARCFIKIKDDKYGLEQTLFDDPTYDNKKDAPCSLYSHFAMPNDCHSSSKNKMYVYFSFRHYNLLNNKTLIDFDRLFDFSKEAYSLSKNQIDQKMIETAYANIMHKVDKNATSKDIYDAIKIMAKESFKNQVKRKFVGNLTKATPIITKSEIENICDPLLEEQYVYEKTM